MHYLQMAKIQLIYQKQNSYASSVWLINVTSKIRFHIIKNVYSTQTWTITQVRIFQWFYPDNVYSNHVQWDLIFLSSFHFRYRFFLLQFFLSVITIIYKSIFSLIFSWKISFARIKWFLYRFVVSSIRWMFPFYITANCFIFSRYMKYQ